MEKKLLSVSRRGFLAAAGAGALLAQLPMEAYAQTSPMPSAGETIVAGAGPHNCGGRCVTKAYVQNSVIKRFVTDERPDLNIIDTLNPDGTYSADNPQRRACVRCRSNRDWIYRSDRLLFPMKQTKTRGDLSGFTRITWEQAFKEIGGKLKSVAGPDGKGAQGFYTIVASGDGGSPAAIASARRLLNLFGGHTNRRSSYSDPSLDHMTRFCFGADLNTAFVTPPGNSRQDIFNADRIVLWSQNSSETVHDTNTSWYITQARDSGKKIYAVDTRVSRTANALADKLVAVMPGTDSALVMGMLHHLITKQLDPDKPAGVTYLDFDFIKKYVFGFFDEPEIVDTVSYKTHYHKTDDKNDLNRYVVPAGASWSAFIMGSDDRLVKAGLNKGTSIYPGRIGYNTNPDDELYNKSVPIYGQMPKTPEWASRITGVPADTIRWFAEEYAFNKVYTFFGGGFNRIIEQEGGIWSVCLLGVLTKNFGEKGRSTGCHRDQIFAGSIAFPLGGNKVQEDITVYDLSKCTVPGWMPTYMRKDFPAFLWTDLMENAEDSNLKTPGKSRWNDGQVKRLPKPRVLMNFAGNMLVNQDADPNAKIRNWLLNKNRVEMIVTADFFMTPSAQYSDYILPAAMGFEKTQGATTWGHGAEALLYMGKAIEPQGSAMSDYEICAGIAKAAGGTELETAFRGAPGKKDSDWVDEGFNSLKAPISIQEWKTTGIYASNDPSKPPFIAHEAFRKDPEKNSLMTPSGKIEAYSISIIEDYEARYYNNNDPKCGKLMPYTDISGNKNPGRIYSRGHNDRMQGEARFVYPIPMYIPMVEGIHADGKHPDPLMLKEQYPFFLNVYHMLYRSHSTFNDNGYLTELYKRDKNGAPAYMAPNRPFGSTWDDGVYEPVYVNPKDANALGITTGDRLLVENKRGRIYASATVSEQVRPGTLAIGQGSWFYLNSEGTDVGGCASTLLSNRPSRICQGAAVGSNTYVAVRKA